MTGKTYDKFEYFVPEKFPELLSVIKEFLNSPDPGVVISAPYADVEQRTDQIIQDYSDEFELPLVAVDIKQGCEDINRIEAHLNSKGQSLYGEGVYVFVRNLGYCFDTQNTALIDDLTKIHLRSKTTKFIYFFTRDILSPENIKIYGKTNLFAQIYYYPLLSKIDAQKFLKYVARKWNLQSPGNIAINHIIRMCGGHTWLLTNAMREYRYNHKFNFENYAKLDSTKFRVSQISKKFSREEIHTLRGLKKSPNNINYLRKIGIITKKTCNIKLILDHLNNLVGGDKLQLKDGDIFSSNINLKHAFTDQEYIVLKLLLQKNGSVSTRDEIAEKIWKSESDEKFSVWAIEQLIKRLRKKMLDMNITASVIKTIRSEGYKIE